MKKQLKKRRARRFRAAIARINAAYRRAAEVAGDDWEVREHHAPSEAMHGGWSELTCYPKTKVTKDGYVMVGYWTVMVMHLRGSRFRVERVNDSEEIESTPVFNTVDAALAYAAMVAST